MTTQLKALKVFDKIKKMLKDPIPLPLMIELLKPYVSYAHGDSKSIKDFLKSCYQVTSPLHHRK